MCVEGMAGEGMEGEDMEGEGVEGVGQIVIDSSYVCQYCGRQGEVLHILSTQDSYDTASE